LLNEGCEARDIGVIIPMHVQEINCQALRGIVAQKLRVVIEAVVRHGGGTDSSRVRRRAACIVCSVPGHGAGHGYIRGQTRETGVRFVEAEDGVCVVVLNTMVYVL
jgi:hypothetical protein